jgi:hypothetical protein
MSPRTILVVAEPFGKALGAVEVAAAIGRGLCSDPSLKVDPCALQGPAYRLERTAKDPGGPAELRTSLDAVNLDARLRSARAVVIAAERLDRHTLLRRGAVFEVATRARQGGVPCYAVAAHNTLDLFEARILDLQIVLEAGKKPGLRVAGSRLARTICLTRIVA